MGFGSKVLRICDINFQPANSKVISIELAKTLLYVGAHVATGNPYEHFHHGIVVDLTGELLIIHFWGQKKRDAHVQTTTLPIFIAGGAQKLGTRNRQLHLVNYPNDTVQQQQETCQRAKDMLEKPYSCKFHLLKLNCESFAYFCRTQEWKSDQVATLKNVPAATLRRIRRKITGARKRNERNLTSPSEPVAADVLPSVDGVILQQLCQPYANSL